MPHPPSLLPDTLLYGVFTYGEARDSGVGRARLSKDDVVRAHHGLYVPRSSVPTKLIEQCEVLLPALGPHRWFSHATAARLWGMPLPSPVRDDESLHVLSLAGAQRLRRPGIYGWECGEESLDRRVVGLLPLIAPAEVWAQLAVRGATEPGVTLTREWLVAVGEYLLAGPRRDGRRHPLCTREELQAVVSRQPGKRGARALTWALERMRHPVDSPKETQLRLGLIAEGLPEPSVQVPVMTAEGLRHSDLGYPDARVLIEYQGDEHRMSRTRWLADLRRVQLFEDSGYRVILVGADDVDCASDAAATAGFGPTPGPGLKSLAARVRRALKGRPFGAV